MSGQDTIVAVSSGAGVAGVAVIRISGREASNVLAALGVARQIPRRAEFARLLHPATGETLDRALALYFPGPNSFTGEDVAELHVHGGRAVQAAVISAILSAGPTIRPAEAGEFTRRAFSNGKLDLAEAEGLAALIDSETEWQRRQAMRLLEGELGRLVATWRAPLIHALAGLDASLDFADEGDVPDDALFSEITASLRPVLAAMQGLLEKAGAGERLREGFRVAIIGAPNAGKSSLLNAIARRDVAIVSSEAGTTRDIIELRCDIDGLPVTFLDTAGLRSTDNAVEREGIRRAQTAARDADVVLLLSAVDSAMEQTELAVPGAWPVMTKIDRHSAGQREGLAVSVVTGEGIEPLLKAISVHLKARQGLEPALLAEARQRRAVSEAALHVESVLKRISGGDPAAHSEELLAESLRLACRSLDRLIGRVDVEDILNEIFSRFCIGK